MKTPALVLRLQLDPIFTDAISLAGGPKHPIPLARVLLLQARNGPESLAEGLLSIPAISQ